MNAPEAKTSCHHNNTNKSTCGVEANGQTKEMDCRSLDTDLMIVISDSDDLAK